MTIRVTFWVTDGDSGAWTSCTQQELWDFLKAERRWQDKVRQWLRAEGVNPHILKLRRRGQPEQPQRINRAARRRITKNWKRISVGEN